MNNEEYEIFLNRTLVLIENAVNFLRNKKHIVAYNKMLGVHQKLLSLAGDRKIALSLEELSCQSIFHYMLDGRYDDAAVVVEKMRVDLYQIYGKVKTENEKNRNESV
jgi:hypothetical protein